MSCEGVISSATLENAGEHVCPIPDRAIREADVVDCSPGKIVADTNEIDLLALLIFTVM